ncbi:MAG: CHC2 zinc finger domain-containing protein [Paraclostridium sp.]
MYETVIDFLKDADVKDVFDDLGLDLEHDKTLCPFVHEDTASCHVYQSHGSEWSKFYCYGCGEYGNLYELIGAKLKLEHKELRRVLDIRSNGTYNRKGSASAYAKFMKLSAALEVYEEDDFSQQMIRTYLHERLVTDEMITKFKLGFINAYRVNTVIEECGLFFGLPPKAVWIPFVEESGCISYGIIKVIEGRYKYPKNTNRTIYTICSNPRTYDSLVITEGQFDAMHLSNRYPNAKILAIGGNSVNLVNYNICEFVVRITTHCALNDRIILVPDRDDVGGNVCSKLIHKILNNDQFCIFNIWVLVWDGDAKDYNDALLAGATFSEISFMQWLVIKNKIKSRTEYINYLNVLKEFILKHSSATLFVERFADEELEFSTSGCKYTTGDMVLMNKENGAGVLNLHLDYIDSMLKIESKVGFFLTLCGLSGSGKSRAIIYSIVHRIRYHDGGVLLLSLDMDPEKFMEVVFDQYEAVFDSPPSRRELAKIKIPNLIQRDIDTIIPAMRAVLENDSSIDTIYIDNLDNIGCTQENRYEGEADICEKLATLSKKFKIFICLLVQAAKSVMREKVRKDIIALPPDAFKGSIGIRSNCDAMVGIVPFSGNTENKYIAFFIIKSRYGKQDEAEISIRAIHRYQCQLMHDGLLRRSFLTPYGN